MSKKLFVLGHPVGHSKSPAMHNAAYRALGLDWEYGFADRETESDALRFLQEGDWMALNVTMPYKPLALRQASSQSDAAIVAQGANVLVRRGDELLADNTDGKGCISYLARCGVSFAGARVIVCGTGPTSLSLMHAAMGAGAAQATLLGRDEAKAKRVLEGYRARCQRIVAADPQANARESAFGSRGARGVSGAPGPCGTPDVPESPDAPDAPDTFPAVELHASSYALAAESIAAADIILDATPLGMGAQDPAPFDTALLRRDQVVFDVVYGHGETALMAAARSVGCAAYDGFGMLVAQAVETVVDIVSWLDVPVDLSSVDLFEVMRKA